jgi:hypothetical protein
LFNLNRWATVLYVNGVFSVKAEDLLQASLESAANSVDKFAQKLATICKLLQAVGSPSCLIYRTYRVTFAFA